MRIFCRALHSRVTRAIVQALRRLRLSLCNSNCEIDGSVFLGRSIYVETNKLPSSSEIKVGSKCILESGVRLECWGGSVRIGNRTFMGPSVFVYGHGGVVIGDDVLIAMNCIILSSEHAIPEAGVLIRSRKNLLKSTKIGNDVWLGANVVVTGGVEIGDGCVVGAGAVVTRSLPANSIAYGIPAKVVGFREVAQ